MQFIEFEHKFIIDPSNFDVETFKRKVIELQPTSMTHIDVEDTYYVTQKNPTFVVRHRCDQELQQLSIKTIEGDPESRTEINLELDQKPGNQQQAIKAFLTYMNFTHSAALKKVVDAFYFDDCEIVYYQASTSNRTLCCIEVEAKGAQSRGQAINIIGRFEKSLGLDLLPREKKSLYSLLIEPQLI